VAAGGRYALGKRVSLNLGFTGSFAIGDKTTAPLVGEVNLTKRALVYALGLECGFL